MKLQETILPNPSLLGDNQKVADIILEEFRLVLSEPEMNYDDDFFDFGGHSLLATRVIGKLIQNYGMNISFNDFFVTPTAKGLAQKVTIEINDVVEQKLPNSEIMSTAPLSFAQDFLWQAYKNFNFDVIYNLPFAIKFHTKIDENLLFKAFNDVMNRHASLRTIFKTSQDVTTQHIVPIPNLIDYKWYWSSAESENFDLLSEANYRFNLAEELPLRVSILQDKLDGKQILSLLIHHMVIDEWSLNLLMADLKFAYYEYSMGREPKWQNSANSISEFAKLQQAQGLNQNHLKYWVDLLTTEYKNINKKLDPVKTEQEDVSSLANTTKADAIELTFTSEIYKELVKFSKNHQISIFATLYSVIAIILHKIKDMESIIIGTSASGRTDANFFDTIGYFTTMVAHPITFKSQESIVEKIQEVAKLINDSMMYADIPINIIQEHLGIKSGLIFDTYIHIHTNNALYGSFDQANGTKIYYEQIPPQKTISMFGLHFEIMDNITENGEHVLKLIITYQKNRYDQSFIEMVSNKISKVIGWIVMSQQEINTPISNLDI